MDSTFIIEKSVVILVVFAVTMLMAMYSTWAEIFRIELVQTVPVGEDYCSL
jgi:hypothetical protein